MFKESPLSSAYKRIQNMLFYRCNKIQFCFSFHPPATVSPAPASKRLQRGQYRSVDSFPPDVSLRGSWLHWLSCHRCFPATRRIPRGSLPSPAGSVKSGKQRRFFHAVCPVDLKNARCNRDDHRDMLRIDSGFPVAVLSSTIETSPSKNASSGVTI